MANISKRRRKEFGDSAEQTGDEFDVLYRSERETANRWSGSAPRSQATSER